MIKTLTKIFAFTAVTKSLLETKKSQSAGTTQIHPSKIPGRTVFIREKEYFIRENIKDGTTPIIFLHSWGSDSLGSWFKILPKLKMKPLLLLLTCVIMESLMLVGTGGT